MGGPIPRPDQFASQDTVKRFGGFNQLIRNFLNNAQQHSQPTSPDLLKIIRHNASILPSEMHRAVDTGQPIAIDHLVTADLDNTDEANAVNVLLETCGLNGDKLPRTRNETLTALTSQVGGLPTETAGGQAYNPIGKPEAYRVLDAQGQTQGLVLATSEKGVWLQLTGSAITNPRAGDRNLIIGTTIAVAPKSSPGK